MSCPTCGTRLDRLKGGYYDGWTVERFMREADSRDGLRCGHCDGVIRPLR